MTERVSELVAVIVRMMQDHPESPPSEKRLRSLLVGQGYAKRDIDAAIKLAWPRFASRQSVVDHKPGSMRSLSLYEDHKLATEARDGLARLDLAGIITPYEREIVLDHLGHFDGPIGMEELDYLLSWLVCGGRDVEYKRTLADVLAGKGDMLH